MRHLILASMVIAGATVAARADTLTTLDASQVASQQLDACFERSFEPGRDKAGDKASKQRLLDACSAEWDTAAAACHANTGNPLPACRKQAGSLADDYLGLKGAGLQQ